jgi:cytochrome c2
MEMLKRLLAAGSLALAFGPAGAALAQDEALIAEGESVFRRCAACHQVGADAQNRVGPQLATLIGRKPGGLEGFDYSDAMIAYGEEHPEWTEDLLFTYLEDPRGLVKGTKMAFAGLKSEEDRRAVIAYIVSQQAPATN